LSEGLGLIALLIELRMGIDTVGKRLGVPFIDRSAAYEERK
jgi:hypothetical protein